MSAATARTEPAYLVKRKREMVTPEGIAVPVTIATRGMLN